MSLITASGTAARLRLACVSLLLMLVGLVSWIYLHHRWPDIGRTASHA